MFNAFISYSHAADGKLAPALQNALEKFAKPWYKIRYLNIFRDEASLTASPHLWTNIQTALEQSEYLIYMASPVSASSKWIIKEIEYWLEHKSIETLLVVLTDGEIAWDDELKSFLNKESNSLPDILENKFSEEPFYIDLRAARTQEDVSLNNPIFKKEVLKLAAHLHGKQPKDLAGEEVSAHNKMIRVRNGAIAILGILLFIAVGAAWIANVNANEAKVNLLNAELNQRKADSNAIVATQQRDSAVIARKLADQNALIAKLQTDTAQIERDNAIKERNNAQANFLISEAQRLTAEDPTLALRLSEVAMTKRPDNQIIAAANKIYRENTFYRTIVNLDKFPSAVNSKDSLFITCIAFSPDGKYFLSGSYDIKARLWDINGHLIREFRHGDKYGIVRSVAFSTDGKLILTRSIDDTAKIWNRNGELLRYHSGQVAFSPNGNYILTTSLNNAILRTLDGSRVQEFKEEEQIMCVAYSPDGKTILTGSYDHSIRRWDIKGNLLNEYKGHSDYLESVSYSPDGEKFISVSDDKTARLWSIDGKLLFEFKNYKYVIKAAAFSPDGRFVLIGSDDHVARLWTLDGNLVMEFKGHQGIVSSVAFSPDGKSILTGSLDHTIKLWRLKGILLNEYDGDLPHYTFQGSTQLTPANTMKFDVDFAVSPNGKYEIIAMGKLMNIARLYGGNQMIREFVDPSGGGIVSVGFSPESNSVITGACIGSAKLWDLNGYWIAEYETDSNCVNRVAFSEDGQYILTRINGQKIIRVWDRVYPLSNFLQSQLVEPLSAEQKKRYGIN